MVSAGVVSGEAVVPAGVSTGAGVVVVSAGAVVESGEVVVSVGVS